MKIIHTALILFLCFGVNAQTMFVRPITGTQSVYPVTDIQKLTFSGGNLIVNNTIGSSGTFALAANRYINFTDLTLGTISQQVVKNSFYVYPNPVSTVLNITNEDPAQSITHLEIISLEGRVLMKKNTFQVDISALPRGMYFCRITSNKQTQTIKFLKQ